MTYTAPTVSSSVSFAQWNSHTWNFEAMLGDLLTWYGAAFGTGIFGVSMFAGIVMLIIFGVQAIRQESLILPGAVIAIIGASNLLINVVPMSMQPFVLMIFVVLPTVGIIYDIYRKR